MDCSIGNRRMEKLRELTDNLPTFPGYIEDKSYAGYKEYKMEKGECFAWFIHRSGNDVAVHRWFNSKDSIFPEHVHPEKEWIIVYKGSMDIIKKGEVIHLNTGELIFNEPNVPHSARFPEECRYLTIMIPPSKEYPNVG